MRIFAAMIVSILTASQCAAFEFIVKERGPASTTLQAEIAAAVTEEAVSPLVKAVIVDSDDPDRKVAVSLYLSERIAHRSVAAVGKSIRAATSNYAQTMVSFHIADEPGHVWATAHSTPQLVTRILGLDREQYLVALQGVDANKLKTGDRVVAEAVMPGSDGGAAQIIRNGKLYYFRQFDRETDNSTDVEIKREKGRYWIKCCSGTRYLVTKTSIEVYDDKGFVHAGRRLK